MRCKLLLSLIVVLVVVADASSGNKKKPPPIKTLSRKSLSASAPRPTTQVSADLLRQVSDDVSTPPNTPPSTPTMEHRRGKLSSSAPPSPKSSFKYDEKKADELAAGRRHCVAEIMKLGIPVCSRDQCYDPTASLKFHCRKEYFTTDKVALNWDLTECTATEMYTYASHLYNSLFIEEPSFIALPRREEDVQEILKCAYDQRINVAVKSGGHSYAGGSTIDNTGILVFMSEMHSVSAIKKVKVTQTVCEQKNIYRQLRDRYTHAHKDDKMAKSSDKTPLPSIPESSTSAASSSPAFQEQHITQNYVTVESGARWVEIYNKVNKDSDGRLFAPGGTCPSVSTGYALGGGVGPFSRLYGMGLDNVLSFRLVKYDGSAVITVSEDENPELFFALRGAGQAAFGIVVSYDLKVHPFPAARPGQDVAKGDIVFTTGEVVCKLPEHKFKHALELLHEAEALTSPKLTISIPMSYREGVYNVRFVFDYVGKSAPALQEMRRFVGAMDLTYRDEDKSTAGATDASDCVFWDMKRLISEKAKDTKGEFNEYPSFALEHANHLSYYEDGGKYTKFIFKNVLLSKYTRDAAEELAGNMQVTLPGVRDVYTMVQFPGSAYSQCVDSAATAFPYRNAIFMLVRVGMVAPPRGTEPNTPQMAEFEATALPRLLSKVVSDQIGWHKRMMRQTGPTLVGQGKSVGNTPIMYGGQYVGFPDAFPYAGQELPFEYWGANFDKILQIQAKYEDFVGNSGVRQYFNPLALRAPFVSLGLVHTGRIDKLLRGGGEDGERALRETNADDVKFAMSLATYHDKPSAQTTVIADTKASMSRRGSSDSLGSHRRSSSSSSSSSSESTSNAAAAATKAVLNGKKSGGGDGAKRPTRKGK